MCADYARLFACGRYCDIRWGGKRRYWCACLPKDRLFLRIFLLWSKCPFKTTTVCRSVIFYVTMVGLCAHKIIGSFWAFFACYDLYSSESLQTDCCLVSFNVLVQFVPCIQADDHLVLCMSSLPLCSCCTSHSICIWSPPSSVRLYYACKLKRIMLFCA